MAKNGNSGLGRAKKQKDDEFHARLEDVGRGGGIRRLLERPGAKRFAFTRLDPGEIRLLKSRIGKETNQ